MRYKFLKHRDTEFLHRANGETLGTTSVLSVPTATADRLYYLCV